MFFRKSTFVLLCFLALPGLAEAQKATVVLTAYNAAPGQTDGDPNTNAAGTDINHRTQVAVSPDLQEKFPFGTIVKIVGPEKERPTQCGFEAVKDLVGDLRVVTDLTAPKHRKTADVLLPVVNRVAPNGARKTASDVLGHCAQAKIIKVGYVDVRHMPNTAAELAHLVAQQAVEVADAPEVPRHK